METTGQSLGNEEQQAKATFRGYRPPTSSTTYTPNQFFDVVLPHASRGCLRLVAYLIRKTLGWSDEQGNPTHPEAYVSYRELIDKAGISRGAITDAVQEALDMRFIQCLRLGQAHRRKEEGFPSLYSLKWDEREKYIANPDDFDGFFAGNGNLTHIPNDFFDFTIPNEPLSVIQVIGVIIRNTIGFQTKYGFRVQEVRLSFSDIMRRTGMGSRTSVSNALKSAIEGYHIVRVEQGVFDPCAGIESKASVYAIRWSDGMQTAEPDTFESCHVLRVEQVALDPVADIESDVAISGRRWISGNGTAELDGSQGSLFELTDAIGSKSGPANQSNNWTGGETVQKVDRSSTVQNMDREIGIKNGPTISSESGPATAQKVDSNEFKKRTAIKTTLLNNLPKQQHQTGSDVVGGSVSLALLIGKLMGQGIEASTAARLVDHFPAEQIERQLEWIELRDVRASKTGLLIRAIERDMPQPGVQTSERSPGWMFAAHFYAELAGNANEPTAEPSSEDVRLSSGFLTRVGTVENPQALGRQFARLVKNREKGKPSPIRTLTLAFRLYSDEHFAAVAAEVENSRRRQKEQARAEHEKRFTGHYAAYKQSEVKKLESDKELSEAFELDAQSKIKRGYALSPTAGRRREESFADPVMRAEAFLEFAANHRKVSIPTFWDWDATINEEPFSTEGMGE